MNVTCKLVCFALQSIVVAVKDTSTDIVHSIPMRPADTIWTLKIYLFESLGMRPELQALKTRVWINSDDKTLASIMTTLASIMTKDEPIEFNLSLNLQSLPRVSVRVTLFSAYRFSELIR